MMFAFLFLQILNVCVFAAIPPRIENLTEIVGSVDKTKVSSRDVKMDWVVEHLVYNSTDTRDIFTVPVTSKEFDKELNRVLMEMVVYEESKLFKAVEIAKDEVKSSITKFNGKLNKDEALSQQWKKLDVSSSELETIVSRKAQAKNFILFKSKASLIPVTEAETFNYYKNNRKKFGTKPYKDFKDSIKNFLSRLQADQRISEWFGILKKKYQVRKVYTN